MQKCGNLVGFEKKVLKNEHLFARTGFDTAGLPASQPAENEPIQIFFFIRPWSFNFSRAKKVSTPHRKDKEAALLNEVQFLLTLQHIGIPRAYGIYDMKLKGRRAP